MGGRVRGHLRAQSVCDHFQDTFHIPQDIIVPETQHRVVTLPQPLISQQIMIVARVLATIYLDDQAMLSAHEIHHVVLDRLLSNELAAVYASSSQSIPESHLCVR
jgi:hypothetical protein